MGFIKMVLVGFAVLTVIYASVSLFSRSVRRERLEKEYDAAPVDGISRDDYVSQGMEAYHGSFRPKLLLLIYVVPIVLVVATVYITNAN